MDLGYVFEGGQQQTAVMAYIMELVVGLMTMSKFMSAQDLYKRTRSNSNARYNTNYTTIILVHLKRACAMFRKTFNLVIYKLII